MSSPRSLLLLLALVLPPFLSHTAEGQKSAKKDTVLKAAEITPNIFPDKVFYRGKVATVQMRNTVGIHFADDPYVLAGLVDTAGYTTGIREKYQAYFLSEVPLNIDGESLPAGAYGIGFVSGSKFVVTDLGAGDVLQAAGARDIEIKHPVPLQIVATDDGAYRLYLGRDYVTLKRSK
jgi:hypothetical protein